LTLFEPTIAMRYGYKKKSPSTLDVLELFEEIATTPVDGVSSDNDWIDHSSHNSDIDEAISEVWTFSLCVKYVK
jgi:hypothetical protein